MTTQPWPPLHAYALAHRCTTCKANPGEQCNAPQKQTAANRSAASGVNVPESWRMHATRQDAGRRHYGRDVGRAAGLRARAGAGGALRPAARRSYPASADRPRDA